MTELYTWNLYNFINQCHHNKYNKTFLKVKFILEIKTKPEEKQEQIYKTHNSLGIIGKKAEKR